MPNKHRSQNRRTLRAGLALLAPLGLLACTGSQSGDVPMEAACQFKACVCAEADAPLLIDAEEVEVKWREENGDAYCPEGYELVFDDQNKVRTDDALDHDQLRWKHLSWS